MMTFDYSASAELFIPKKGKAGVRQPLSYRRFASAAEAIRFAVEDFPAIRTLGAWMRVGDQRFNGDDIRRLYESNSYPRRGRRIRKSS
jgi:Arc/MetJ-type ribon-helix-helix transcriptional regulator